MKTTLKVLLSIALFASIALADGNQGTGGSPMAQPDPANDQPVIAIVVAVIRDYLGLGY